jgi:predicted RNA-binding protein Jag
MSEANRRFFSGDTLRQALVQAANHFNVDPERIAYRSIEKRHGFLKTRRRVVIEVDPAAPQRAEGALAPTAAPAATASPSPPTALPAPLATAAPAMATSAAGVPADPLRPAPAVLAAPPVVPAPEPVQPAEPRVDPERRAPQRSQEPRPPRAEPRWEAPRRESPRPAAQADGEGLISLPERPLRASERFPPATGAQAEAARKGIDLLLAVAGLDLSSHIHQGEDRLEVELSGPGSERCFDDEGELLMSIEHLLTRVIRSLSGETVPCRVDCDNFHEIREEQLRTLAQRAAEEVRRRGRPRTLEPMNPADRRVIHMTLADDPHVATESDGEGYFKRITIRPS